MLRPLGNGTFVSASARRGDWRRLEELVRRVSGGGRARHPEELREFWRLYRGATSRLAALQAEGGAGEEEWYLNRLVGAAHAILYRTSARTGAGRRLVSFLARGWPAQIREAWRAVGVSAAVLVAGGLLGVFYASRDPAFVGLVAPPELLAYMERGEMWTGEILSIKPAASSAIFSNNVTVAATAFALGITAGLGTLWILLMNGVILGAIAWLVAAHGMAQPFWSFVIPHGVLEIPAAVIAGAAGLLLGQGMLVPGDRPRGRALAESARRAVNLLGGCVPVLLVAAAVEGFFSPEPYPFALKLGAGALLGAAFIAYLLRGRPPARVL